VSRGYDLTTATQQAYAQIKNIVRREAYVMAFDDAFLVVGVSLLVATTLVWFCRKKKGRDAAAAH
jgi:DHA2 family multidrug resistance protein